MTTETALRRINLKVLREADVLGQFPASQEEAFAEDENMAKKFGKTCRNVPDDIINFQHAPLACAISLGWNDGIENAEIPLKTQLKNGLLDRKIDADGKPPRIVSKINGKRFSQFWIDVIINVIQT